MSRLTDKMNELSRKLDIFSITEFNDLLKKFDEGSLSDMFMDDIIVYLNEEKTKCLTVVLLDSSSTSIQLIEENTEGGNPIFLTKNLTFYETTDLMKTIMRRYKIKKIKSKI